jgi:hypothetical protein
MSNVRSLVNSTLRITIPTAVGILISFLVDSWQGKEINWATYACYITLIFLMALSFNLWPSRGFLKSMVSVFVPLVIASFVKALLFGGEFTWMGYVWFVAIFVTVSLPFQVWGLRTSNT